MAPDECCFRCVECGTTCCYVETCGNYSFYGDVTRTLCGFCATDGEHG